MKDMFKNLGTKIIEELIKLTIILVIYYFSNIFTVKEVIDVIKGSLAIIVPYFVYILVLIILSILKKPIVISIKMKNKLFAEKEETELCHYEGFREDARTVILDLYVKNNNSCWAKLAKSFVKNKKLTIRVELEPLVEEFICQPCEFSKQINFQGTFFTIDISQIILSRLDNDVPTKQQYKFMINENRDNPPRIDGEYHIKPLFLLDEKSMNFIQKKFINYSIDMKNDYYVVNFRL